MASSVDPTKTPLLANHSGAPPDFTNGPSLLHAQLGMGIALVKFGSLSMIFRLGTNLKVSRKLGLDDCKWVRAIYVCILSPINGQPLLSTIADEVSQRALCLCISRRHRLLDA